MKAGYILHGTYGRKSGAAKCVLDEQSVGLVGQWKLLNVEAEGCVRGMMLKISNRT